MESEYHRPETWGEQPPITRGDVLRVAEDIHMRGQADLANKLVEAFDDGLGWAEQAIADYYEYFDPSVDGIG